MGKSNRILLSAIFTPVVLVNSVAFENVGFVALCVLTKDVWLFVSDGLATLAIFAFWVLFYLKQNLLHNKNFLKSLQHYCRREKLV